MTPCQINGRGSERQKSEHRRRQKRSECQKSHLTFDVLILLKFSMFFLTFDVLIFDVPTLSQINIMKLPQTFPGRNLLFNSRPTDNCTCNCFPEQSWTKTNSTNTSIKSVANMFTNLLMYLVRAELQLQIHCNILSN